MDFAAGVARLRAISSCCLLLAVVVIGCAGGKQQIGVGANDELVNQITHRIERAETAIQETVTQNGLSSDDIRRIMKYLAAAFAAYWALDTWKDIRLSRKRNRLL